MKLLNLHVGTVGYDEGAGTVGGQIAEIRSEKGSNYAVRVGCLMSPAICPALEKDNTCRAREYDRETGDLLDFGKVQCGKIGRGELIARQLL